VGDGPGQLAQITTGLEGAEPTGGWELGMFDPLVPHQEESLCGDNADDPVDAVLQVYWNTGAGFVQGPVAHEFDDVNAHAAFWLDFVGAKAYDINLDAKPDLLMPALGDGSDAFTNLYSNGDGTFTAEPSNLPSTWPAYVGDEEGNEWRDKLDRLDGHQILSLGGPSTFKAPEVWMVGVEEEDGDWLVAPPQGPPSPITRVLMSDSRRRERLSAAVDGLGATTSFTYGFDDEAAEATSKLFPKLAARAVRVVVSDYYTQSSPNESLDHWTYSYKGATEDALNGTFLGYEAVTRYHGGFGETLQREYDFSFDVDLGVYPNAGVPYRTIARTTLSGGDEHAVWVEREPTLETKTLIGGETYFSYTQTETRRTFSGADLCDTGESVLDCSDDIADARMTTTTSRTLDEYGTVETEEVAHLFGDTVTTNNFDIVHDTDEWLMGQVGSTVVLSTPVDGPPGARSATRTFDPTTGAVDTTVEQAGTPAELTTSMSHDAWGNVTGITQEDGSGEVRTTTIEFDVDGAFPEKSTNAMGHESWFVHEPVSGVLAATVDPNGITLVTALDGFFRPLEVERRATPVGPSDGAPSTTAYLSGDAAVPLSAMRVQTDLPSGQRMTADIGSNAQPVRSTWYGIRPLGVDGNIINLAVGEDVAVVHRYDNAGRETVRSLPAWVSQLDAEGVAPHETTTTYDNLGRVTVQTHPNDTKDLTSYHLSCGTFPARPDGCLRAEHTDADMNTTTSIVDSHGRVVLTADGLGTRTCMNYGKFGQLDSIDVDCQGLEEVRTTSYTYDSVGRLASEQDPVSGLRSYQYNGFGDLVWASDGEGMETDVEVDALGRVELVTSGPVGALEVNAFDYDTALIGALANTTSADGVIETFAYDPYGRLSSATTDGLDVAGPYAIEYEYDAADRLRFATYPSPVVNAPMTFEYGYDISGYLRSIERPAGSEALWLGIDGDPDGKFTTERLGDNQTTTRLYDPATRRPESVATATPGAVLQLMEYAWTDGGELDVRDDLLHAQSESFVYDAARRLREANVDQGPAVGSTVMTYNRHGDILSKTGVGTYVYDVGGQLNSHGDVLWTNLGYDDNGNMTARGAQALTYTPFEKVRTLSDGGGVDLSMRYTAGGERVVREDAANDVHVITLGEYEQRLDGEGWYEERVTLPTPTGSAVRTVREGTAPPAGGGVPLMLSDTEYVHSLYLGSGALVTNDADEVVAEVSFDAWGAARNAANWTESVSDETLVDLGVGFTGHAAEPDGGLTNMGGRMYDSALGRFVQRDPLIANPANGSSYNKYSYVENSPLRLVDPSGYSQVPDDDTQDGPDTSDVPGADTAAGTFGGGASGDGAFGGFGDAGGGADWSGVHPNGVGNGGIGAPAPPAWHDDGLTEEQRQLQKKCLGGSNTACYAFATSLQPGSSTWTNPFSGRIIGKLYKMAGSYALGVAYGMAAVELLLVAGEAVSAAAIKRTVARLEAEGTTLALEAVPSQVLNGANHVFGPKSLGKHKLEGVLRAFGGDKVNAFYALQNGAQSLANAGAIKGVFQTTVRVAGQDVTVRGRVVDNVVKLSTAFIP